MGMLSLDTVRTLTDDVLLGCTNDLVRQTRRSEASLIAHMGEVDARRLYLREAAASMFLYATRVLHLSEAEAYLRITVARAAREHPALLERLASGGLHLSAAALLAPQLTVENRDAVLARAVHKSKRQIEELVAELAPRPDVPASIRKLPEPRAAVPPTLSVGEGDSTRLPLDAASESKAETSELLCSRSALTAIGSSSPPAWRYGTSWSGFRHWFRIPTSRRSSSRPSRRSWSGWKPGASAGRRLRGKPWPRQTRRAGRGSSRHR